MRKQRYKIMRDTDNYVIGGVCSGISRSFDRDPTWMRLIFVLLVIAGFSGGIIYIILWIIIPEGEPCDHRDKEVVYTDHQEGYIKYKCFNCGEEIYVDL